MHQPHPLPGRRVTLKQLDTVAEPRSRLVTLWFRIPRRARIASVALMLGTALVQLLEHGLIVLPAIVLVSGYYVFLMMLLAMLGKRWWELSVQLPGEPVVGPEALNLREPIDRTRRRRQPSTMSARRASCRGRGVGGGGERPGTQTDREGRRQLEALRPAETGGGLAVGAWFFEEPCAHLGVEDADALAANAVVVAGHGGSPWVGAVVAFPCMTRDRDHANASADGRARVLAGVGVGLLLAVLWLRHRRLAP